MRLNLLQGNSNAIVSNSYAARNSAIVAAASWLGIKSSAIGPISVPASK